VNSKSPSANYGGTSELKVDHMKETISDLWSDGAGGISLAYLKFDLSSIPEGAYNIEAQLGLYTGVVVSQTVNIIVVFCEDNDWSELGITWSNRPSFEGEGFGCSNNITKASTWYGFTINMEADSEREYKYNFVSRALAKDEMTLVLGSDSEIYDSLFNFVSRDQKYSVLEDYRPFLILRYDQTELSAEPSPSPEAKQGIPGFPLASILIGLLIAIFGLLINNRNI
jgi:hypothetical protein